MSNVVKIKKRERVVVDTSFIENLEPTENLFWIRETQFRQYGMRGIPGNKLTVAIPESRLILPEDQLVLEIGAKDGKFGGSRIHLCLRYLDDKTCNSLGIAENTRRLHCIAWGPIGQVRCDNEVIFECAQLLRTYPLGPNPARIVSWHWNRYYRFLEWSSVKCLAEIFQFEADETLTAVNRRVSRELYAIARSEGWRKLTLREQKKYGVTGQWHRVSAIEYRAFLNQRPDVSEYTIRISRRPK